MLDILMDAGLDSVKMLPFLYLAYLLIEWIMLLTELPLL